MFKVFNKRKNDGKSFEALIQYVYQSLIYIEGRDIEVRRDVKIIGKSGAPHQIDAYYEFLLAGVTHRVAIECKDHKRPITKGNVQEFYGKLQDLDNCIGIMVSSSGFQQGAPQYAKQFNIELLPLGEMPLLARVASARIGVMLPSEKIIGQPFWTIMENSNRTITGSYISFHDEGDECVFLFVSKKFALKTAESLGGSVRGVTQQHLKVLISLAKYQKKKFIYYFYDENVAFKVTPDEVQEKFLVEFIDSNCSL